MFECVLSALKSVSVLNVLMGVGLCFECVKGCKSVLSALKDVGKSYECINESRSVFWVR